MSSEAKYKQLGNGYHWNWAAQGDSNAYVAWVKQVVKAFPNDGNGKNLLDVGCGDGYPASLMVMRGYLVTGVDTLPGPLEVAREMVPAAFARFTEEYPMEAFDYVLALESIEHMRVPKADEKDDPNDMSSVMRLVRAVNFCKEYAIITTPRPGLDPYSLKDYALADIAEIFPGCQVEQIYEDDEHQMFKVVPGRSYVKPNFNLEAHQADQERAAEVFPDHLVPDFEKSTLPPSKRNQQQGRGNANRSPK